MPRITYRPPHLHNGQRLLLIPHRPPHLHNGQRPFLVQLRPAILRGCITHCLYMQAEEGAGMIKRGSVGRELTRERVRLPPPLRRPT